MPTPKQVRYHYGRVARLRAKLQDALTEAHGAKVIVYPDNEQSEKSPCWALHDCWTRFKASTEKQLAQAMRDEIYRGNW